MTLVAGDMVNAYMMWKDIVLTKAYRKIRLILIEHGFSLIEVMLLSTGLHSFEES